MNTLDHFTLHIHIFLQNTLIVTPRGNIFSLYLSKDFFITINNNTHLEFKSHPTIFLHYFSQEKNEPPCKLILLFKAYAEFAEK